MTVFTQNMASARVAILHDFLKNAYNGLKRTQIIFRKKLLYACVWGHDIDRNDYDFDHEKFEWIILTFRCGDTN